MLLGNMMLASNVRCQCPVLQDLTQISFTSSCCVLEHVILWAKLFRMEYRTHVIICGAFCSSCWCEDVLGQLLFYILYISIHALTVGLPGHTNGCRVGCWDQHGVWDSSGHCPNWVLCQSLGLWWDRFEFEPLSSNVSLLLENLNTDW